jgi:hypothetical protein
VLGVLAGLEATLGTVAGFVVTAFDLTWTVTACVFVEALGTAGEVVAAVGVEPGAEAPLAPLGEGLDAWADFSASCFSFSLDVATASWALAMARVRPSTPGAEP